MEHNYLKKFHAVFSLYAASQHLHREKDPYIIQMTIFFLNQFKMLLIFSGGQNECNLNQCTFLQPTYQLNLLETVVK